MRHPIRRVQPLSLRRGRGILWLTKEIFTALEVKRFLRDFPYVCLVPTEETFSMLYSEQIVSVSFPNIYRDMVYLILIGVLGAVELFAR